MAINGLQIPQIGTITPDITPTLANLVNTINQGQKQQQIAQTLSSLQPGPNGQIDPTPLLNATYACIKAGRTTRAKAFARRATQDFDKLPAAQIALGDALVADGEKTLAKNAYEAAKKLPNADAAAIDAKISAIR